MRYSNFFIIRNLNYIIRIFVRNLILQGTARSPLVNNYNNQHNVESSTIDHALFYQTAK